MLLPEQFDWAGGKRGDKLANAETLPGGPAYAMAQAMAKTHRIFLHAGSIMERVAGEDRIHNTTVVFNREGEEIARYRKIHLFDVTTPDGVSYRESETVKPGDAVVTYDCEGVTVGCSICYDLRFPDLFLALAEKGADHRAARRLHDADRQGSLGSAVTRPRHRDRDVCLRQRANGMLHGGQRTAPRPMATRWSPTPGATSSPRPPTGSASCRPGSIWPGESGAAAYPGRAAQGSAESRVRIGRLAGPTDEPQAKYLQDAAAIIVLGLDSPSPVKGKTVLWRFGSRNL